MEIFRSALIGSIILLITSCSTLTLKDPEVRVVGVDVTDISAKDLSVDLKLNIDNPNSTSFKLGKIIYGLSLAGDKVTEGTYNKGVDIPANGATDVVIPLKFAYSSLQAMVGNLLKKSVSKEYELKGSVDLGFISIPFTQKGDLKIGK